MPVYQIIQQIDNEEITINIEMDAVAPKPMYEDVRDAAGAAKKVVSTARDVFGEGIELARSCAVRVVDGIKHMDETIRPNEFEVQFAIKLDAEVGAILAKMGTEAQLQVSMKWTRKEPA